jgi:hypothetical protein
MNLTFLNINLLNADNDTEKTVYAEIAAAFGASTTEVTEGHSRHWDDEVAGLLKVISRKHPGVIIDVWGDGEQRDDMWAERFRDGKSEIAPRYKDPAFLDILTPTETESAYSDACLRFHRSLNEMSRAAVRYLRDLKELITGGPDRYLDWSRLNDAYPQLRIGSGFGSLLTYALSDDAEQLNTEEDPVCIDDLSPDYITKTVSAIEDFLKEIKNGVVTGEWDEEDEIYRLYYTHKES